MRISERKKQLRERTAGTAVRPDRPSPQERQAPRLRPARQATPAASRPASRRSGQPLPATTRQARKRSPRFYLGFGLVGLVFSVILVQSTVANYNSAHSKYLTKLAQYHTALAKYHDALAKYAAQHGHNVAKPQPPVIPQAPTLTITDFLLPILYGLLSIAYLYLGYRASKKNQAQA